MIDMEEGVLNQVRNSPLSKLFDDHQIISSTGGSGNNWAIGYCNYGLQYGEMIIDSIRKQAEHCDSLQSFVMVSSLGGGTGSGLGSYLIEQLAEAFPEVHRFNTIVLPSDQDDVVTSPYNS